MDVDPVVFVRLILAALFFCLLGAVELGRLLGKRQRHGSGAGEGTAVIEGSLFALMGLLVAFTFDMAQVRLERRRELVAEEANALGTAYLRLDLLPVRAQPAVRAEMRSYVDERIAYYQSLMNRAEALRHHAAAQTLSERIWRDVATASDGDLRAGLLLLPAVNAAIDIVTVRKVALEAHTPLFIYLLLVGLALVCAYFAGLAMGRSGGRSAVHTTAFAVVLSMAAFVMLSLDYPRVGFVHLGTLDAYLVDARGAMK